MKIAHVRERHGPAGSPWRLAAAFRVDPAGDGGPAPDATVEAGGAARRGDPTTWLDLEVARRRLVAATPALAHDHVLFRQPVTTLDDLLARGLRVEALRDLVEPFAPRDDDDALLATDELRFGPPILRPPAFRDFYAFEQHVGTMWKRRGGEIPENWYRLPVFYFSNTSEIRGPGDPVWAPRGSAELDLELEVGALVDTPAFDLPADRALEAIGGYFVLNDWSARDLQRDEMPVRMGPAKGKDFATSIGPWLVTPDEVADAWATGATGPDLAMSAFVTDADGRRTAISDGRWASARYSFGAMLARASADVHVRPGEILGSGTVGTGCLLEVKDATLGRWLEPGDTVTLSIERLGTLTSPVVERPR